MRGYLNFAFMLNIELFPAQVLFLQAPSRVTIEEVFSVILRDLVINRVLNLAKLKSYPTERSKKTQKYYRFIKGTAYEGYEPMSYETRFLSPFEDAEQVQSKVLTNFVLRKYSMPSGFTDEKIFRPLAKDKYISSLPILKTFGYYSIKSKTKQILSEVDDFINNQEQKLESLIDGDKAEFISTMNETGTYIFQFENKNPELFKNIISMVKRIYRTQPLGPDNDLTNFMEAFNVDMRYFDE